MENELLENILKVLKEIKEEISEIKNMNLRNTYTVTHTQPFKLNLPHTSPNEGPVCMGGYTEDSRVDYDS